VNRTSILVVAVALHGALVALAAEFTEVPNSVSPDGHYAARTEPSTDIADGRDYLILYRKEGGDVFVRLPIGGYARYPQDADPANLLILWAPESKHFALMVRGTKRSWTTTIYAMDSKRVRKVKLPSPTAEALELVSASEINRASREAPTKWIDNDHLLLRASGDTTVDGKVMSYEVDLTYSLKIGKVTESKVVSTKS
jgi:hypothetical protein